MEEALGYLLAKEFNFHDAAKNIFESEHAGAAKKILGKLSDDLFAKRLSNPDAANLYSKFEERKKALVFELQLNYPPAEPFVATCANLVPKFWYIQHILVGTVVVRLFLNPA